MPGQAAGTDIGGFTFKHGISQGYVNACKGITWRNTMSQPLQSSSQKTPWVFLVTGGTGNTYGLYIGEVTAVDPRDAVTRALTSETAAGKFIGEHVGVPIDVVLGVPCNYDTSYALTRGEIYDFDTGDTESTIVPHFIGATAEDRARAQVTYGIHQAEDWLAPVLGKDAMQQLAHTIRSLPIVETE